MKKILLGTSALIGAATLLAGAAFAEDPKVTVGGFSNFEAGWVDDDFGGGAAGAGRRDYGFRNDTEIHFNIAGKTDAGLGYGAEIDLEADVTADTNLQGLNAHRTYGWLQGDYWGRFEMGSNDGAAAALKVDAANLARAAGGINGDYVRFANVNANGAPGAGGPTGLFTGAGFITASKLPVEHGATSGWNTDLFANNNKLTYYTPRFSGFQLGVSYSPNLTDRGQTVNRLDSLAGGAGNIWSGGVNYEGQWDAIGIAAAVTGEHADGDLSTFDDISAWNAGAKLTWLGFSVAGSYGDWSESSAYTTASNTDGNYWTAGGAYEWGPFGASVTYLSSELDPAGAANNKFEAVSAGLDFKLAPGLTPFVEYTHYDIDPTGGATDNTGAVVLVGSQLSF